MEEKDIQKECFKMRNEKKNPPENRCTIHEEAQRLRQLAISSLEELKKRKNEKIIYLLKN